MGVVATTLCGAIEELLKQGKVEYMADKGCTVHLQFGKVDFNLLLSS